MPVKKMCAALRRAVFDESQRRPLLDGRMGAGAKAPIHFVRFIGPAKAVPLLQNTSIVFFSKL
jgi:hypothetical protein